MQAAQHQIGVGHSGMLSALPVAGRPGVGARRCRPHLQHPSRIHAGDRASTGADGMHIHHGNAHWPVGDAPLGGEADIAIDQRDVRGSAPHIKGHNPLAPGQARHVLRPHQPACWPG